MYLSRLTFQTNTVRHQNITKLKCQDVKLDQLSRCQNEKVRVKTATKKWTNAGEKRGEKTILASKKRFKKSNYSTGAVSGALAISWRCRTFPGGKKTWANDRNIQWCGWWSRKELKTRSAFYTKRIENRNQIDSAFLTLRLHSLFSPDQFRSSLFQLFHCCNLWRKMCKICFCMFGDSSTITLFGHVWQKIFKHVFVIHVALPPKDP